MEYSVVTKIPINRKRCKKVGAFLYDPGIDGLFHESPWPFPVQIGVTNHLTKCYVTPMFLVLPFIMKGWINHDILLRLIELLSLAKRDMILMHGSCVDHTLIVGLPNSGKTYQTYKNVHEGGELISEEYTIIEKTNNGKWRAMPYKPIMRTCFSRRTLEDCGIQTNWKEKLWLSAATLRAMLFPFMYEAVIWKEIPASGSTARINEIKYGSSGRQVPDWKEFAILCANEFPFMASEFLQAYALASGFDILGIQQRQRDLIKEFVNAVYPTSQ